MPLSVHLRSAAPGNFPQLILDSVNQDGGGTCPSQGPPLPLVTMTTAVDDGDGGSGGGGGWGGIEEEEEEEGRGGMRS